MKQKFEEKTHTVLIVDDNATNIKVIALTLRAQNYKLVIATNGNEAIELVDKTRPDLILLDVMMPGMDGYETCSIIKSKEENENIPVLFLTALNDKENIVKGFNAGGVDYITKPFNKDEFLSRVRTHLELKHTRDELEQTSKHLASLNSLKDKMFSVIGHDLRSPLGSVKMTLEFLADTADSSCGEEMKSTLDLMVKTTDEVFSLLENLLGWAKSQSGNLSIEPETISLKELIQNIYLLNKGNLGLKELDFKLNVADGIKVFADLNTLQIVFRNLLSNAIKFTPDKGSIVISATEKEDKVNIVVKDTGVGIPKESIPKLFDSTLHFTTYGTNRESGSGIGLMLCQDFIKRNNGEVRLESEVGKGTSFIVVLPKNESLN